MGNVNDINLNFCSFITSKAGFPREKKCMSKLCAAGAWRSQRLLHNRLRSLWAQGMEGQRERKGRASGIETPSEQKGKRPTLSVKKKEMSAQFGFPGRVGSGQGGTRGKVKILSFGS